MAETNDNGRRQPAGGGDAPVRDIVVVGGGPAGLATAIAAGEAGLDAVVLEKGALVNSLYHYPTNLVFFTTPELLEIGGLPFVTPYEKPTRAESLRYYRRVTETYKLNVELGERVVGIAANGGRSNGTLTVEASSAARGTRAIRARAVVIATGCYDFPNQLGVPGEDLPHVSHYYREAHPHYRAPVVVVGGKNSAAETALDLYRAGARVTLVHRQSGLSTSIKYWVLPDIQNRIAEGSIAARFDTRVVEIRSDRVVVERKGVLEEIAADAVYLLTGYRADVDLLHAAGVATDPVTLAPQHDPATLETNVAGLYLAGAVVSGRQSGKIFIENGRFHGETVVGVIKRRLGR